MIHQLFDIKDKRVRTRCGLVGTKKSGKTTVWYCRTTCKKCLQPTFDLRQWMK